MLRYLKIDAFSDGRSTGNPAGVVYLKKDEFLSPQLMQDIAKREKGVVSEVVFCTPSGSDRFSLRYYSSESEVMFCGHGTIACMYSLIKSDPALAKERSVMIETPRGSLPVLNDIEGSDSVYIVAPSPIYLDHHVTMERTANALGVTIDQIDHSNDIALIDGGLRTLIIPLTDLNAILRTKPDMEVLNHFCIESDVDIILVYCPQTSLQENGYRTRVFAPRYGYLEDPATGSGNSAFGYYLISKGAWDGRFLSIEQGPDREYPNIVRLRSKICEGEQRVMFGGGAVVRYEKSLEIPEVGQRINEE